MTSQHPAQTVELDPDTEGWLRRFGAVLAEDAGQLPEWQASRRVRAYFRSRVLELLDAAPETGFPLQVVRPAA